MASSFVPVAYGIDDVTLGFDMTGSRSLARLQELPGTQTRRGKMLGDRASWGKFAHLLGRSVAFWKADTSRLYVQAKLAPDGRLCAPAEFYAQVDALRERMAVVGLVSHEDPWVTRIDVAVDAECSAVDRKLLLDGLESVRPPNGWRTSGVGVPRSTVYFKARTTEKVYARAYCRNLKTKTGEAFELIRLEAEAGFDPRACPIDQAAEPAFAAEIWKSRYGNLASRVTRLAREVQTVEIAARVKLGELTYAQGERLPMYLDLERLGLARTYYPKTVYAARRREAARLGYSSNELGASPLEVELADLLEPYVGAVDAGSGGVAASLATLVA
jgi:hypothetical protein